MSQRHPVKDAFHEGAAAYLRDVPRSKCPYLGGSFHADAWHLGFTAAFLDDSCFLESVHASGGHRVSAKSIPDHDDRGTDVVVKRSAIDGEYMGHRANP